MEIMNKQEPIIVERLIDAPVSEIWKAFTEKERMKKWYFDVDDFKPEVGFVFHFDGQNEGRVFHHECKVTTAITEKKLAYSWRYLGHEGESLVTFEFTSEGNKTRVKLTHIGVESFPQTKDFLRTNFEQGWAYIVGTSLVEYFKKA